MQMVSLYRDPRGERIFTDQRTTTVTMDVAAPHGMTGRSDIKNNNKSSGLIINSDQSSGLVTKSIQSDKSSKVPLMQEKVNEEHVQKNEVSLVCLIGLMISH